MTRLLLIAALMLTATAFLLPATANPLAGVRDVAKNTRQAAEEKSQEVADQAEGKNEEAHEEHAEHGDNEHGEHAAHGEGHAGHDHDAHHGEHDADHKMLIPHAVAVMFPTEGNDVSAKVTFVQTKAGVRVTAEVSGLNPNQKHGFHIHEFGDLSAADGTATGGHYNPEGHDHALPEGTPGNNGVRHAGDLGNLEADADGHALYQQTFDNITIAGTQNPILGRGVIIHAKTDDGGQPTGNAGARIAQGVIGVAK